MSPPDGDRPATTRTAGRCRSSRLAAGLPDRLAGGRLRRPPGVRQVPGADEPGVRRRPVLDRGRQSRCGRAGRSPRRGSPRSAELEARRVVEFRYPDEHEPCLVLCLGPGRLRRLRPEVHAPLLRRGPAPGAGRAALPVPQRLLRGRRAAGRSPARRAGRCRGSRWRSGTGSSTPPGSRCGPSDAGGRREADPDPPPEGHDRRRHPLRRGPAGRAPALAADGHDERLPRRGRRRSSGRRRSRASPACWSTSGCFRRLVYLQRAGG